MNANLLNCFECGATISRDAKLCPKCNTHRPFGVMCSVCKKWMKASEAIAFNPNEPSQVASYSPFAAGYHTDCYRAALALPFPQAIECGHCHKLVRYSLTFGSRGNPSDYRVTPCPECGNPGVLNPFDNCDKCLLPVILGIHSAYTETEETYDGSTVRRFHAYCYPGKTARRSVTRHQLERAGIWKERK